MRVFTVQRCELVLVAIGRLSRLRKRFNFMRVFTVQRVFGIWQKRNVLSII
jgi:hypothetical protein